MTDQLALGLDDDQLPPWAGVTTVLGQTTWPGDGLLKWAWTQGSKGILLTDRASHQRRDIGNEIHRIWESLCEGRAADLQALPVHVRGFAESLARYHADARPTVLAVELPLRHPTLRVRGRIDSVRACDGRGDRCRCALAEPHPRPAPTAQQIGVVFQDLKTGGRPEDPVHAKDARQVAGAYPILWDASYPVLPDDLRGRPVCGAEIIRVRQDGAGAIVHPIADRRDGFMHALRAYRDMQDHGDLPERGL